MNPSGEGQCRDFDYSGEKLKDTSSYNDVDEDEITNASDEYYISPQARYRAKLIKDKNERVAAIYFEGQ
ncbi:hypothetical protein D3C73_1423030 [compost metagenome]